MVPSLHSAPRRYHVTAPVSIVIERRKYRLFKSPRIPDGNFRGAPLDEHSGDLESRGSRSVTGCDFTFNDRESAGAWIRASNGKTTPHRFARARFHQRGPSPGIGATRSGPIWGQSKAFVQPRWCSPLFPPMSETLLFAPLILLSSARACHLNRDGDASATRSTFSSHRARFFRLVVAPIARPDRMQLNTITMMLTLMHYFCMYNGSIKISIASQCVR